MMYNRIPIRRSLGAFFVVATIYIIAGWQLSFVAFSDKGEAPSATPSNLDVVFEPAFEAQSIEALLRVTKKDGQIPEIWASQATLLDSANQALFEVPLDPLGPGLFRFRAPLDRITTDQFYIRFALHEIGKKDEIQTLFRASVAQRTAERIPELPQAAVSLGQQRNPSPRKPDQRSNREVPVRTSPIGKKNVHAISTSQSNSGFDLLVWTAFADYMREYPNTLDAISDHSVPYTLEETDTTDASTLQNLLEGKDVFLVPEQEAGSNDTVSSIADGFSSVLQDFVRQGGRVIAVSDYRGFLSSAGLMPAVRVTRTYGSDVIYQVTEPNHPLTFNLGSTIRSANATDGYEIDDQDTQKLVVDSENNAIVAVKSLGAGEIILIGYDYYNYNGDASWLVANAVRWAAPVGPDTFGYTADDNPTSYAWIDATRSTNTNISGDDQTGGPFDLGFQFPFFEKQYSQVYASTNGLITLESGSTDFSNDPIPSTNTPNTLIAPFWDDLVVDVSDYNSGAIYYRQGGDAPNRYFVVEWYNVSRLGSQDLLTFETILYENGDIKFQYASLNGWLEGATIGVEDSKGELGLQYLYNASGAHDSTAVLFTYPSPRANILVQPTDQFAFAGLDNDTRFIETVRNIGTLGSDTVDLPVTSDWTVEFRNGNDTAPLRDTDRDGTPDTGSISQGGQAKFVARVTAPASAKTGDWNVAHITARSSRDPGTVAHEMTLNTAVAPDFVQVFQENYAPDSTTDYEIYVDIVGPSRGSHLIQVTDDTDYQGTPAVTTSPSGEVVVAWPTRRYTGEYWIREIEYAILDAQGNTILPTTVLIDHSNVITTTYDDWPTVAFLSNGNIAFTWSRYVGDTVNAYYAVRSRTGQIVREQVALGTNTEEYPRDYPPAVAPLSEGNFVVTWEHAEQEGDGVLADIYYTVLNNQGATIAPISNLTNNSGDYDDFTPRAAALNNEEALLLWAGEFHNTSHAETCYAVIDTSGNIDIGETALTNSGTTADNLRAAAAALANDDVLVAWSRWADRGPQLQYTILDKDYEAAFSPRELVSPAGKFGWEVSVSADRAGRGVLTWLEYRKRDDLLYALIDSSGSIVTPVQSYRHAQNSFISSSWSGYGNAPMVTDDTGPSFAMAYLPMISHQFGTITVSPIKNGNFETGSLASWTHGGGLTRSASTDTVHTGGFAARLGNPVYDCNGGVPADASAWMYQAVEIPATSNPTLSFWYRIQSQDDNRFDWFTVQIRDADGQPLQEILKEGGPAPGTLCVGLWDSGWRQHTLSLSAYRGQTVQIFFENRVTDPGAIKGYYNTWTYVDDVQLNP